MRGRTVPLFFAAVLSIPPMRFVAEHLTSRDVDRTSTEWRAREAVLSRARVFVPSPPDIATLDLSVDPADPRPFRQDDEIGCTYVPKETKATSAKFDCRLDDGSVVKVKYGFTRERNGEVAATRLLAALGFPADHVSFVRRVRCKGCPPWPFQTRRIAEWFLAAPLLDAVAARSGTREFDWVSVERKMKGRALEVANYEGWDWWELEQVDPERGGASRAEIDALRLMAIFLAHWDNKATNQRLVCRGTGDPEESSESCDGPLLMLQDVGSTFGPGKVIYESWQSAPIWKDEGTCVVSMETLPYGGAGFRPTAISEGGRALLGAKLARLSETQIRQLIDGARFPDPATGEPGGDVTPWVRAFQAKVRQIAARPACPSLQN